MPRDRCMLFRIALVLTLWPDSSFRATSCHSSMASATSLMGYFSPCSANSRTAIYGTFPPYWKLAKRVRSWMQSGSVSIPRKRGKNDPNAPFADVSNLVIGGVILRQSALHPSQEIVQQAGVLHEGINIEKAKKYKNGHRSGRDGNY